MAGDPTAHFKWSNAEQNSKDNSEHNAEENAEENLRENVGENVEQAVEEHTVASRRMLNHPQLEASGYRCLIHLPVQWGDQDAFGHVNNTVPIRWFESSRIAYLEQSGIDQLLDQLDLGPILAAISCNYRRQLRYPDTVWIGGKVTRLGNSSLSMAHAVWSDREQTIAAEGDSTLVVFDYDSNRPRRVPDEVREAVRQFEGHSGLSETG